MDYDDYSCRMLIADYIREGRIEHYIPIHWKLLQEVVFEGAIAEQWKHDENCT